MRLDVWDREVQACPDCAGNRVVYTGEVATQDRAVAVFGAFLYDHHGSPEVFIDATFGTFATDDEASYADHVTFGARTGHLDEHPHFGCTLVTGGELAPDSAIFGRKLTRYNALVHPMLPDFWSVNDTILCDLDEIGRLFKGSR